MKIILENEDFEVAVQEYVKSKFNIDVKDVDIAGTKGKYTATISLDSNTVIAAVEPKVKEEVKTVKLGGAELEILPEKKVDPAPFVTEKAPVVDDLTEDEPVVEEKPVNLFATNPAGATAAPVVDTLSDNLFVK